MTRVTFSTTLACLLLTACSTSTAAPATPPANPAPASPVAAPTQEQPPRLPPAQPAPTERPPLPARYIVTEFAVPAGSAPHDVAPARDGGVWYAAQRSGMLGWLDPKTGAMQVWDAPKGRGPYGITATPDGNVYYASLAGSYVGHIDTATGAVTVLEPPTPGQGARRVWSDSQNNVWVSEWNSGQLSLYRPAKGQWQQWKLPGARPQAYAVYVDERDAVWLSDWGNNTMVRFDPLTATFLTVPLPSANANVRQILGRPGEVWLPLSGVDKLAVIRPE